MKKYSFFVGIDVSRVKLDVTFLGEPLDAKRAQQHVVVSNDPKGSSRF